MKKHIILTKLFEFGGSNTYLKTLVKYWGAENIILLVEDAKELSYLENIINSNNLRVIIKPQLHSYAHLNYSSIFSNVKEGFRILKSILSILLLSVKYGFADLTISAVEPERHLYLLWTPLIRVFYVLHTEPKPRYTTFTKFTCDSTLGKTKHIITVSMANKMQILRNWNICEIKRRYVHAVHNCLPDDNQQTNSVSPLKENTINVITMGHLISYKNPHLWYEVAKHITSVRPNIHFYWLGNGPLFEEFKSRETESISYLGFIKCPDDYLKDANIYYQPSLQETHGISVIEAMKNELPCVVSNIGGLPESVKGQYNGILVGASDLQEHIAAFIQLIDNPSMTQQFGLNSSELYKELFSYATFQKKMQEIYG